MNGPSPGRLRLWYPTALVSTLLFTVIVSVPRRADATDVPEVKYDHAAINANWQTTVTVSPGDSFKLVVENTCPNAFDFSSEPIQAPKRPGVSRGSACVTPGTEELTLIYDSRYSGYFVNIRSNQQVPVTIQLGGKLVELNDVTLVITFASSRWDYELAGGFTFSHLTDPEFGLVTRTVDGAEQSFVVRDREAEDDANLGAGAFIHVFHERLRPLAVTFGLGISEESSPAYYAGLSWRWGGRGALTLGYNWGEVDRLPAGTSFDEPVDANLLGSLGSRIDGDWFFGLSYTFLNPGTKPFTSLFTVGEAKDDGKKADTDSPPAPTAKPIPPAPAWSTDSPKEVDGEASLEWEPVPGVDHYEVLRSTSGCDDHQPTVVQRVRETSYTDGAIEVGVTYYYSLRTVTGGGASRQGECREITIPAAGG